MNYGNNENERSRGEIHRHQNKKSAKEIIALTGFGVRVQILEQGDREARCRRLQDGKEIMVPVAELIFLPPSDPIADQPRELFQHDRVKWRDPGDFKTYNFTTTGRG